MALSCCQMEWNNMKEMDESESIIKVFWMFENKWLTINFHRFVEWWLIVSGAIERKLTCYQYQTKWNENAPIYWHILYSNLDQIWTLPSIQFPLKSMFVFFFLNLKCKSIDSIDIASSCISEFQTRFETCFVYCDCMIQFPVNNLWFQYFEIENQNQCVALQLPNHSLTKLNTLLLAHPNFMNCFDSNLS